MVLRHHSPSAPVGKIVRGVHGEEPDFVLHLEYGGKVGVEITRSIDQPFRHGLVRFEKWCNELEQRLLLEQLHVLVWARVRDGRMICFTSKEFHPTSDQMDALVALARSFVKSGQSSACYELADLRRLGCPLLSSVSFYSAPTARVARGPGRMSYGQSALAEAVEKKAKKLANYSPEACKETWLVVHATTDISADVMMDVRPPESPFDRIFTVDELTGEVQDLYGQTSSHLSVT